MAGEVSGVDILIYVNTGTVGSPVYTLAGGQRGATLKRTTEVADAKHKSSGAWPNRVYTFLDWSITAEAVVVTADAVLDLLEQSWFNRKSIQVQVQMPGGSPKYTGTAVIADFSLNAPHNDVATVSIELQGNSSLVKS